MQDMGFEWITAQNINDVIRAAKQAPFVGLDTETTALHPRNGKIRLIQIAVPEGVFLVDCFQTDPRILLPLFDGDTRFVGHHLAFDLLFLDSVGLTLPHGQKIFCTMIAGQVLDAGLMPQPSHSLEAMAPKYTGISVDKAEQRSDWSGVLTMEQLAYAAKDAAVLLPLAQQLTNLLVKANLVRTMKLEMRALPGMMWLTKWGIRLDVEGWKKLAHINKDKVDRLELALAIETDSQHINGYSLNNWRSPAQVVDTFNKRFLKSGKTVDRTVIKPCHEPRCNRYNRECSYHSAPVTESQPFTISDADNETLGQLAADGDELAKLLQQHRKAVKARDTYGLAFLQKYLAPDGRIYSEWRQIGAATGRMASSNPNGQNIPHSTDFRSLFIPDEGHLFALADYSQIEFRICIELSRDPFGLQGYASEGTDVHLATAISILGLDPSLVTSDRPEDKKKVKDARQVAKSLNFGLIFGAGSETLRLYAMSAYDVILTPQRADQLRKAWRKLYQGIVSWQQIQGNGPNETRTLGDRRALQVDSYMAKLNYPVQGTGIDGLKAAIALCYERRHQINSAAHPSAYVHDELVFSAPAHAAEDTSLWLQKNMEEAMRHFLKIVPVEAEPKVIPNWGDK